MAVTQAAQLLRTAGSRSTGLVGSARSLTTSSRRQNKDTKQQQQSTSSVITNIKSSQPAVKPDESKDLQELKPQRALLYPDQMEWLDERSVRISRPTKNVMQSGTAYTNTWKIEFNSEPRYENWLMGWTSSNDPVSNLGLTFPTKEAAIAFCEKNQLQWFVEDQPERKLRRKSYADNFSWNKRTRLGSK